MDTWNFARTEKVVKVTLSNGKSRTGNVIVQNRDHSDPSEKFLLVRMTGYGPAVVATSPNGDVWEDCPYDWVVSEDEICLKVDRPTVVGGDR